MSQSRISSFCKPCANWSSPPCAFGRNALHRIFLLTHIRQQTTGSEILPCRGRRVGPCRTCRGETCTGCVCVLRSHLNLAICLCPKYLLTFSWLKPSYSKSDWVLGTQKHLILILFSAITLKNKETEGVELFCPAESCCIKKSPNLLANGTWFYT